MNLIKPRIVSSLKLFGGKFPQLQYIVPKLEFRGIFVEGMCGTSVISINLDHSFRKHFCFDLNRWIVNFFKVLQTEPARLQKFLLNTEYSRENFERAKEYVLSHEDEPGDPFFDAAMYFYLNRSSRSADMKTYGWSDRLRRNRPEYISSYQSAIDNLSVIAERIKHIQFLQGDYIQLMLELGLNEESDLCQYLDPPYEHSTRSSTRPYGSYEMTTMCADAPLGMTSHQCLLDWCKHSMVGTTYLSTYPNTLYEAKLRGYKFYDFLVSNSASQAKTKPKMCERLYVIDH